jgi:hypothetical protein
MLTFSSEHFFLIKTRYNLKNINFTVHLQECPFIVRVLLCMDSSNPKHIYTIEMIFLIKGKMEAYM